jgi:hypothetical protein
MKGTGEPSTAGGDHDDGVVGVFERRIGRYAERAISRFSSQLGALRAPPAAPGR